MNPLTTRNICFSVYYNGLVLSMFVCRCPMWYFQVVVPIISLYPDSCGVQPWPDEIPTTQTSLIIIKPGKIHAVFTQDQRCKRWPFDSPFCLLLSPQDATPHTNIAGFVNINSPIQPCFDPRPASATLVADRTEVGPASVIESQSQPWWPESTGFTGGPGLAIYYKARSAETRISGVRNKSRTNDSEPSGGMEDMPSRARRVVVWCLPQRCNISPGLHSFLNCTTAAVISPKAVTAYFSCKQLLLFLAADCYLL